MLAETRRRRLLEMITQQGYATLDELVRGLAVSESTIRRDLEALDLAGSIKRTHGGAIYTGEVRSMPAFDERTGTAAAEKRAIGLAAAALIEDGDTVLLDGGTTTLEVARALVGRRVQVVTNSLPIAQLLASNQQTELILIGGYVYPRTGVALGPLAIATMETIRVRTRRAGGRGNRAGGDLQLEFAPGRDRAADDVVRPGNHDRRRPYQVRPAGTGAVVRPGRGQSVRGRFRGERREPRAAGAGRCGGSRGAGCGKPQQRGRARAGPGRGRRGREHEHQYAAPTSRAG